MFGQIDMWKERQIYGWMNIEQVDIWKDVLIDRQANNVMDRQIEI